MTDTASAAPSDAEIDAQWRESVEKHETTAAFVRDFARAVLANWGTPAQISESDAAYWLRHRALILQAIEDCGFRLVSSGGLFWLHGPSHPAQAGAVPLTDGQVEPLLYKYGYDPDDEHMAAMLKEANGIKGGQHGAE